MEYVRGVRRIIGQIILKHPFVAAFSISIQNLMAMDRTTMFSFFIRKRLHYSSCRQDEIIVIVVGRWRIQFCLQKGFSSRHGLMIFCPSAVHLGLAQVLYAPAQVTFAFVAAWIREERGGRQVLGAGANQEGQGCLVCASLWCRTVDQGGAAAGGGCGR